MDGKIRRLGWRAWELRLPIEEAGSEERPRILVREFIGDRKDAQRELDRLEEGGNVKTLSTYRAFSLDDFREWNWDRVNSFMTGNGGCFGVAGPRGIGKTWLLRRGCQWANDQGGLGVYFPAPSAYDAQSFIVAITDAFAATLQRNLRPTEWTKNIDHFSAKRNLLVLVVGTYAVAYLYLYFGANLRISSIGSLVNIIAMGLVIGFASYLALQVFVQRNRAESVELRLKTVASEARQRLRYALNSKEGYEFGLSAGKGIIGSARGARERTFVERPVTLASLVYDFRDMAALTAKLLDRPVVVTVDELDKIGSLDEMRLLLRDIKGIFDISGVSFLVSISDEALRCVRSGAIAGRDEFSSSFYAVALVESLNPEQANDLIKDRTGIMCRRCAIGVAVLTKGNPREIVRLAGEMQADVLNDDDVRSAMRRILRAEAGELMERVIESSLPQKDKMHVAECLKRNWIMDCGPGPVPYSASNGWWISDLYDDPEQRDLCEYWNRLLIRTWVAAVLADPPKSCQEDVLVRHAIDCVRAACSSAQWARAVGEDNKLFGPEESQGHGKVVN